jgi:adenylosuccinate synthase
MKARIVLGCNYGDEGKGRVTANYASKVNGKCLNVLTNGGSQRGHTVFTKNAEHVFKHFGSGTFFGADTYYSPYFICNPMQFAIEYNELSDKCKLDVKLYRHPSCRITTPWDMMSNQIQEISRGEKRHGSCGMGIWESMKRSSFIQLNISNFMMLTQEEKIAYLKNIRDYYHNIEKYDAFKLYKDAWLSDFTILHFINDLYFFCDNTIVCDEGVFNNYDEVIFENGQGLLLTEDATNVHTTPSDTGSRYAADMIAKSNFDCIEVDYVTRPYLTRHGNGCFKNEKDRSTICSLIKEDATNHHNEWQGEFRYGELDVFDLKNRIRYDLMNNIYNRKKFAEKTTVNLNVTHIDELDCSEMFNNNFDNVIYYDKAKVEV